MQHIIFDVDGTMIHTSHVNMQGLQYVLKKESIYKSIEDLMIYDGMTGQSTLSSFELEDRGKTLESWVEYVQAHKEEFYIYQGILTVLKVLSLAGLELSIVTSRTRREIDDDPYLLELLPYFTRVISADSTQKHKPNPEPLLFAINASEIDKVNTVYIGDSIHDYHASNQAGIDFYKAKWGNKDFNGPRVLLNTPVDIIKALS